MINRDRVLYKTLSLFFIVFIVIFMNKVLIK